MTTSNHAGGDVVAFDAVLQRLAAIHAASQRLPKLHHPSEMAQQVIEVLETHLNYEYAAVMMVDRLSDQLVPLALSEQGRGRSFVEQDKRFVSSHGLRIGDGITGWVAANGRSVCVGDVRADSRYYSMRSDIRSELCVPILVPGKVLGVLNIESTRPDLYGEIDLLALETVAAQFAIAHLAATDPLTGICNRGCFMVNAQRELDEARQRNEALALLALDLDRLKMVNDQFGHLVGDRFLNIVAAAGAAELRLPECIGRIGGDEFAIVLPRGGAERALVVRDAITAEIARVHVRLDLPAELEVSFGVAVADDRHRSIDELLAQADSALYRHKRRH